MLHGGRAVRPGPARGIYCGASFFWPHVRWRRLVTTLTSTSSVKVREINVESRPPVRASHLEPTRVQRSAMLRTPFRPPGGHALVGVLAKVLPTSC
eukprot:5963133-Prymnesium_polylepis.1